MCSYQTTSRLLPHSSINIIWITLVRSFETWPNYGFNKIHLVGIWLAARNILFAVTRNKCSWAPHDHGYEIRISSPAISLVRSPSLTFTFCHQWPQSIEFRIKLLFQCPMKARLSIKLTITPIIRGSDWPTRWRDAMSHVVPPGNTLRSSRPMLENCIEDGHQACAQPTCAGDINHNRLLRTENGSKIQHLHWEHITQSGEQSCSEYLWTSL